MIAWTTPAALLYSTRGREGFGMGSFSIWHWIVALFVLTCLGCYVLLLVRARRLLTIADRAARFWSPNLVWLGLVPYLNCLWLPLTVYAIERTSAKDAKFHSIRQDWMLRWAGWLLKFGMVGLLGLFFAERVIIYYVYPAILAEAALRSVLDAVLTAVSLATWIVVIGYTVALLAYPLRLKRHLPDYTKKFAEV